MVLNVYIQVPAPLLDGTECLGSGTYPALGLNVYVQVPAPLLDGTECLCSGTCPALGWY